MPASGYNVICRSTIFKALIVPAVRSDDGEDTTELAKEELPDDDTEDLESTVHYTGNIRPCDCPVSFIQAIE